MQETDYPALFLQADAAAKHAQHLYTRLVQIDLILVVIAALFGVLEPLLPERLSVYASIASALSLAAALVLETATRRLRLQRRWYEDRGIAEAVKSTSWRYMMRVNPFDEDDADSRFVDVISGSARTYWDVARDLHVEMDVPHEIGDRMHHIRAMSFEERRRVYLRDRILDQISYYRYKAARNARSGTIWFWIGIVARGAALVFALLSIASPFSGSRFVELFAAVSAATTAWGELGRHEEQAKTYSSTARELSALASLIEKAPEEQALAQRVADAEGALSRENMLWLVKRA